MLGKKTRITVLSVVLSGMLLAGCGAKEAETSDKHADAHQTFAANGDLQEKTAGTDKLPTFLDPLDPMLKTAYSTAAGVKDMLSSIPCYCGCGESAGHKSNLNCFIKEVNPDDGSVVWDDHGTRCGVCVETAMTVSELSKQGKSLKEIRTIIDQTYSTGKYAPPTPTPEVL
ncbi:PCYCGC motif-containing (lipo)protein [Paenibacillus sp. VCA1]|uniref:PCYCGC motif-containing (lipo)protein n=1 Tax=Paenibacillus sp. VCA1 TaxID=3039148 RepID=UPI0028728152|nr:PCYCGC motif-containing (lipo)protein [Paenibacillus sp. VCA1]MDR9854977.1 PCYCGC motif-containing (lipo)protein [Paenibacillus sp. VCA1]